jgi:3'-phosphoadenosine 5'-phosphosulfate sulfotransferase (PAPS reductase)/FAD synthetase
MAKPVIVPVEVDRLLQRGASLVVSISGGKDSQAMLSALVKLKAQRPDWTGPLVAVHADLGRIEWPQTPGHVRWMADSLGVPLTVVRRRGGRGKWDMVDHWVERAETMKAQGKVARPWSDAKNRFCTSDMKRDPINTYLRSIRSGLVVSAEGLRAEESTARARKPVWSERSRIITEGRYALTWNPILDWRLGDVLAELGSSRGDLLRRQILHREGKVDEALRGWVGHPVYVMGNERLSCAFCILGCQSDLRNAARHNPELLDELVSIEQKYDFAFQQGKPLAALRTSITA